VTRASAEVGSGTKRVVGSGFGLGKRWAVLEVQDGRISEGISRGDGERKRKTKTKKINHLSNNHAIDHMPAEFE
jgi:hypothetical protein